MIFLINITAFLLAVVSVWYIFQKIVKDWKTNVEEFWEILVPASGKQMDFTYEHHKAWDEYVKNISGGITIMKTVKGEWLSPEGELYKDRMIPVRIKCNRDQIEKIVDYTIKHYEQKAVLAYKISDEILLKHAKDLQNV